MSFDNAKDNLKEFGKELNLEGLEFDENNTCILGIDDTFSLHLTYEPNSKRLYLYSPLLDGLPQDDKVKLRLYERLLEGSMLGGQMAGGGVGVAVKEGLILIHCTIDMEHAHPSALRAFAPLYVETVEKWRKICAEICEGREDTSKSTAPAAPMMPHRQGGHGGHGGFIKG
ncbi:MAG: CesT family type III secretion system chaperone [Parachlamydiaceae bacterium]|nr:CesT family type III secretion system chaperone [Parachlamydiaceae bacterium]